MGVASNGGLTIALHEAQKRASEAEAGEGMSYRVFHEFNPRVENGYEGVWEEWLHTNSRTR